MDDTPFADGLPRGGNSHFIVSIAGRHPKRPPLFEPQILPQIEIAREIFFQVTVLKCEIRTGSRPDSGYDGAMLWYYVLGSGLLVALFLAGRWFAQADPRLLVKAVKWLAFAAVAGLILFLALTGRLAWAFATLPVLLAWFLRLRSVYHLGKAFNRMMGGLGTSGPKTSRVETRFVAMTLDHDTGAMAGEVREGEFAGRRLDSLALSDLPRLLEECRVDPQSAQVLEAYLDRRHPDWRTSGGEGAASAFSDAMTAEEACRILGLEPGAPDEAVKEAHRRLISGLHPDHGGSSFLAAKVNQAKDVLLKGKK